MQACCRMHLLQSRWSPVNVESPALDPISLDISEVPAIQIQVRSQQIPRDSFILSANNGSRCSSDVPSKSLVIPVPSQQIPVFLDIRSLCSLTKLKRATLNTKTNKRETGLTQNSLKPCHPGYSLLNMMLCTGIRLGHNSQKGLGL